MLVKATNDQLIRVTPSDYDHPMIVELWSEKSLKAMTVPEIVEVCKAANEIRKILEQKGFRVAKLLGEIVLPGE